MATTKALLDATLDSYVTSQKQWIANQVMPSDTVIDLTGSIEPVSGGSSAAKQVTVAYDGWLEFIGRALNNGLEMYTWGSLGAGVSTATNAPSYMKVSVPVQAGKTICFDANPTLISSLVVRLWRAVSSL